jgi:hypothetical protein
MTAIYKFFSSFIPTSTHKEINIIDSFQDYQNEIALKYKTVNIKDITLKVGDWISVKTDLNINTSILSETLLKSYIEKHGYVFSIVNDIIYIKYIDIHNSNFKIIVSPLSIFLEDKKHFTLYKSKKKPKERKIIFEPYSLLNNNSEHFVNMSLFGLNFSEQSQKSQYFAQHWTFQKNKSVINDIINSKHIDRIFVNI